MIINEKIIQKKEEKEDFIAKNIINDFISKDIVLLVPKEYFKYNIIKLKLSGYKPRDIVKNILSYMLDDSFNEFAFVTLFKISVMTFDGIDVKYIDIDENILDVNDHILNDISYYFGNITLR
jgi:hypothetical protein